VLETDISSRNERRLEMKKWAWALVILFLGAAVAFGGKKDRWSSLTDLSAGKDAKEVAVNRSIRMVQIECLEGSVIVNTVVIREGGAKDALTVGRRFNTGDKQDLDLGRVRNVTGLRISDGGRGRYRISTK
jgi:hypothetical protein